ncbi:hypothetical protein V8E54_004304 [Elaphomyces granulatus]
MATVRTAAVQDVNHRLVPISLMIHRRIGDLTGKFGYEITDMYMYLRWTRIFWRIRSRPYPQQLEFRSRIGDGDRGDQEVFFWQRKARSNPIEGANCTRLAHAGTHPNFFKGRAILTPRNQEIAEFNDRLLQFPGNSLSFYAANELELQPTSSAHNDLSEEVLRQEISLDSTQLPTPAAGDKGKDKEKQQ